MLVAIIIGVCAGVGVIVLFLVWQNKTKSVDNHQFEEYAQKALGTMLHEIVKTTRDQLDAEKRDITETVSKDLKQHTDTFKELTTALKREIDQRQQEIRTLEEDRNKKYGQIAQALIDYKGLTEELRGSTEQLKRVLSSNQMRGSWGELQAEKILEAAGMINGKHYAKQQVIEGYSELKPDFTLYLPNHMELYVDVKFPLSALQEAMAANDKGVQEKAMQQFGNDLKQRIKEVSKYIIGEQTCVDYVILFVPSESVFEIINKHFPAIIDTSFSQKVILVSPHSFFAVVRTIQESYTHFYYEQNLTEILRLLQDLLGNFERFKTEFADVGKSLDSAKTRYDQIAETRYRQIARTSDKITNYQLGQTEQPLLLDRTIEDQNVSELE